MFFPSTVHLLADRHKPKHNSKHPTIGRHLLVRLGRAITHPSMVRDTPCHNQVTLHQIPVNPWVATPKFLRHGNNFLAIVTISVNLWMAAPQSLRHSHNSLAMATYPVILWTALVCLGRVITHLLSMVSNTRRHRQVMLLRVNTYLHNLL